MHALRLPNSMSARTWSAVAAVCAAAVIAGCNGAGEQAASGGQVTSGDPVVLHEGLPHQMFEPQSLAQELATKETVKWGGFPFYAPRIDPSAPDARRLRDLLSADSSFKPYSGPKKCGGFHPDWLVEAGTGDGATRALLCFGCSEVKFLGARMGHFDIVESAKEQFVATLSPYRKNRPAFRK